MLKHVLIIIIVLVLIASVVLKYLCGTETYINILNNITGDSSSKVTYNADDIGAIYISVTDSTTGGIVASKMLYQKQVQIKEGEYYGTVQIKDYKQNHERTYQVTRPQIVRLIKDISKLWSIPTAKDLSDEVYKGSLLHVKIGCREWFTGKPGGCVHLPPSINVTEAQQQTYNEIVAKVMSNI